MAFVYGWPNVLTVNPSEVAVDISCSGGAIAVVTDAAVQLWTGGQVGR